MKEKLPKKIKSSLIGDRAVDLSKPQHVYGKLSKDIRGSQTSRNKRVKVTLAPTPWDKEPGNG